MKIALIYLGRRGAGTVYSLELAKTLARKAEVLTVISRQVNNLEVWRESGLSLLEVYTYHNIWEFIPSTLNLGRHLILRRHLQRFGPDVLYYPMLHPWTSLVNWMFPNVAKVITLHDPILHQGERSPLLLLLQRIATKQASRVILLSQSFVDLVERQGVPRELINIIPHGEFSYYLRADKTSIATRNKPTLLFFGRIFAYKGLDVLLAAFPLVKERIPEVKLLIVGAGDLRPYTTRLTNLPDVTVINRWIPDDEVASYFRQADVLVMPYTDASQSGVIPVAYTFKVPVVAARVGGLSEQVDDGKTGLLVKSGDTQGFAEACIKILLNPALAKEMGEAAYQKAMTEWSWERVAERVYVTCAQATDQKLRK